MGSVEAWIASSDLSGELELGKIEQKCSTQQSYALMLVDISLFRQSLHTKFIC